MVQTLQVKKSGSSQYEGHKRMCKTDVIHAKMFMQKSAEVIVIKTPEPLSYSTWHHMKQESEKHALDNA